MTMKNIQNLHVAQVRIFPEDTIPHQIFSLPEKVKQFKDRYHFAGEEIPIPLQIPGSPKVIIFQLGEAKVEGSSIIIDRFQIEGRKMVLEVAGSSNVANMVFLDIAGFVNEMAGDASLTEERTLTKTEETKCTVFLQIDYWDVFSDKMKQFIRDDLRKAFDRPVFVTNPSKLTFDIIFDQDIDLFRKHRIHFAPKPLTIEPREGIPFDEQIFSTYSPFGSEVHLRLIEAFEKLFEAEIGRKK
jgi:hypothetical protein